MFKKMFFILLALLMILSISSIVFNQIEKSQLEQNKENETIEVSSLSPGIVITDAEIVISSSYVQAATADVEYLEWLLGAPDEIIAASTIEVLDYFLKSPFMCQQVYSCFSTLKNRRLDFSCHKAFCELVSRDDCLEALDSYAEGILSSLNSDELDKIKLRILLDQATLSSLISDLEGIAFNYPNLWSIYTSVELDQASAGDFVGAINGIGYYSAGMIGTANNLSVEVCTPYRDWSSSEIININNSYDYVGNTRIDDATTVYNCHSFAWYRYYADNPYWIMNIHQFLNDDACTLVSASAAQANDIIVI